MAIATLALVGNEAVGKSAALRVLTGSEFPSEHTATFEDAYTWTPGRNFETKNISISILDTAGAPAFDRLRPFSYPGIGIFVVCFAVDDRRSFRDVEDKWVPELKYYVPECAFAVAALKVDLREDEHTEMRLKLDTETVVSADEGLEMMRRIGAKAYAECSAKANIGVLELFEELMRRTIQVAEADASAKELIAAPTPSHDSPPAVPKMETREDDAPYSSATTSPSSSVNVSTSDKENLPPTASVTRKSSQSKIVSKRASPVSRPPPVRSSQRGGDPTVTQRQSSSSLIPPSPVHASLPSPPTTPIMSRNTVTITRPPSLLSTRASPASSASNSTSPAMRRRSSTTDTSIGSRTGRRPSTTEISVASPKDRRRPSITDTSIAPITDRRTEGVVLTRKPSATRPTLGEHQRVPSLTIKPSDLLRNGPTSAPPDRSKPVIMERKRHLISERFPRVANGPVPTATQASPSNAGKVLSSVRKSPSLSRIREDLTTSGRPSANPVTKTAKPTPTPPPITATAKVLPTKDKEVRKRHSISSLWKAGSNEDKGTARGFTATVMTSPSNSVNLQRSKSLKTLSSKPQSSSVSTSAAPRSEKERKVPVWERLTALAKKRTPGEARESSKRSWH